MTAVNFSDFCDALQKHIEQHPISSEATEFEERLEKDFLIQFGDSWQAGWDFDTATSFFEDRGCSLLIQNLEMGSDAVWQWLLEKTANLPPGAIINFEVNDCIQAGQMVGGTLICRRLITSAGIFDLDLQAAFE